MCFHFIPLRRQSKNWANSVSFISAVSDKRMRDVPFGTVGGRIGKHPVKHLVFSSLLIQDNGRILFQYS